LSGGGFLATTTVNDSTKRRLFLVVGFYGPTAGVECGAGSPERVLSNARRRRAGNAPNLPAVLYDLSLVARFTPDCWCLSASRAGKIAYHEVAAQKPSTTYSPYYPDPPDGLRQAPGGVKRTARDLPPARNSLSPSTRLPPPLGAGKVFIEVEGPGL